MIDAMIDAINDAITNENKALYKELHERIKFDNYSQFYFDVIYPFERVIDGFARCEISDNDDISFLISNSQFIEGHFTYVINKKEGPACSADKATTIMSELIKFYSTGGKIKFNYDSEYTFHLPKKVFKTHDEIIFFYTGLMSLYYGNPGRYLIALNSVLQAENLPKGDL